METGFYNYDDCNDTEDAELDGIKYKMGGRFGVKGFYCMNTSKLLKFRGKS